MELSHVSVTGWRETVIQSPDSTVGEESHFSIISLNYLQTVQKEIID